MNLKKLCLILLFAFAFPVISSKAALTIDEKSYDNKTFTLEASGTSSYEDVMVSVFDGDELLAFKTVKSNDSKYSATFDITFEEDKKVIIKVGDINKTEYKLTELDVKKNAEVVKSNKLVTDDGNSLTILDSLKKFEIGDQLLVEVINNFDNLNTDDKAKLEYLKKLLGNKKSLYGYMFVAVSNGDKEVNIEEKEAGYELFVKLPKEEFAKFKNPYYARLIEAEDGSMIIEKGIAVSYDKENGGVVAKINGTGIYLIYDDISVIYNFLDGTDNQTYNLKSNEDLVLKVDAKLDKFLDIYFKGEKVDSKFYKEESGSTIITLSKEYLTELGIGEYDVKLDFTDGEANTTLTIINKEIVKEKNPKTGDSLTKLLLIFFISIFGLTILYKKKLES